jgi:hypothetical protein
MLITFVFLEISSISSSLESVLSTKSKSVFGVALPSVKKADASEDCGLDIADEIALCVPIYSLLTVAGIGISNLGSIQGAPMLEYEGIGFIVIPPTFSTIVEIFVVGSKSMSGIADVTIVGVQLEGT